jgi:hypothetical protein
VFDKDATSMTAALGEMHRLARIKSNFSQSEAQQRMAEWLAHDRRFDSYDKAALVKRVQECVSCGAHLDLSDPVLQGKPPRPLDPRYR